MEERKNFKTIINAISPKKNILDKNTVHHKSIKKDFLSFLIHHPKLEQKDLNH